jgi:hypothetical protein
MERTDYMTLDNMELAEDSLKMGIYVVQQAGNHEIAKILAETPRIYLRNEINKVMKGYKFTNTEVSVPNAAKKYQTVVKNSKLISLILVFTGSLFGAALARAAMTVSLIIQLFHKFILFNTYFGDKLDWFLTATTNLLEDDNEEDENRKMLNKWKSDKLVSEADLNVSTIDAFYVDMFLMLAFFLLRYIRGLMRKVFYSWENKYGRDMYDVHWKLTSGFYKSEENVNYLIKPLIDKSEDSKDDQIDNTKISQETDEPQVQLPKSNLHFGRRLFLKLYGLTYLLEFVLVTRFMADIFIHTSFNIF